MPEQTDYENQLNIMISEVNSQSNSLLNKKFDFFISHVSEDKDTFVRPLAHKLKSLGARVFYDEATKNW